MELLQKSWPDLLRVNVNCQLTAVTLVEFLERQAYKFGGVEGVFKLSVDTGGIAHNHHHHDLSLRVVGAPQMILQPVSFILPCSSLPFGTCRTPGLSIPYVVFPSLPLSALSSSPFHCALQDGFGQTL